MDQLTNQYFNYRETPVNYDGTGTLVDIKGNTVKFNQLVQNGNFADASNWTVGGATLSISNNKATLTEPTGISTSLRQTDTFSVLSGEKLLVMFGITSTVATSVTRARLYRSGVISNYGETISLVANTKTRYASVIEVSADCPNAILYMYVDQGNSYTGTATFENVNMISLTRLNSALITDASSFRSYYNLPYYNYTLGKLLPFKGESLKTTGKNLYIGSPSFDGYTDRNQWSLSSETYNGHEVITKVSAWAGTYKKIFLNVGTYTFSVMAKCSSEETCYIFPTNWESTASLNVTQKGLTVGTEWAKYSFTFEVLSAGYVCLRVEKGSGTTTLSISEYQLEFGSFASSYEPYTENTINLPTLDYFPTGMKSAGDVYDELTESKATTRIKEVTLDGSENWSKSALTVCDIFILTINDADLSKDFLCDKYSATTQTNYNTIGWCWRGTSTAQLRVGFSEYGTTTLNQFKTWLSNNNLKVAYVLTSPTETTIDPPLDLSYEIEWGGTEQILPENSSVPTTSPILCDIDYRTMIPVNADDDPDGSGVITGTGNYRYHSMATLTATPTDEIYRFLRWEDENGDTVSTNSTYTFEVGE